MISPKQFFSDEYNEHNGRARGWIFRGYNQITQVKGQQGQMEQCFIVSCKIMS